MKKMIVALLLLSTVNAIAQKDSVSIVTDSVQYRKLMGVKFKKSQGYNPIGKQRHAPITDDFLSAGVSSISFRIGAADKDGKNDWIGTAIQVIENKKTNIDLGISANYFVKDNMSVGARFSYGFVETRTHLNGKILEMGLDARDLQTNKVSNNYKGMASLRNYFPIGSQRRFYVFNETNLYYSYTESLQRDVYDLGKDVKKLQRMNHSAGIGLSPGIMYFMSKGFAMELALNPIVANYTYSTVITDENTVGKTRRGALDFQFNLLNIYVGFAYYFGLSY